MSGEGIEGLGLERLLKSIDDSNKSISESIAEIKDYMIHNDYRHAATEAKVEVLKADFTIMLEIMESRRSMWESLKKVKWVVTLLAMGILTAAGTGIYNYIASQPAINQHKEVPKAAIKPITKDLIK